MVPPVARAADQARWATPEFGVCLAAVLSARLILPFTCPKGAHSQTDKTGVNAATSIHGGVSLRAAGIGARGGALRRTVDIMLSLAWRDLRVRYKQSLLGVAWAVLLPLSMMLVFTFVFTRAIGAAAPAVGMPYALYAYAGLLPWTLLTSGLSGCVASLVANRNLVTKVYFPREAFPFSCVAGSLVDFVIASVVLVALMVYFHVTGEWHFTPSASLLLLPLVLVVQVMFMLGAGLLLAMGNLFYRDVRQIYGVGIQLLMFVSAVVVPVPADGSLLARAMSVNPLVGIITAYRDCLLHGRLPDGGSLVYAAVFSAMLLIVGLITFRRASHRFAECI